MENKEKKKRKGRLINLVVLSLLLLFLCGCQKQDDSMNEELKSLGGDSASGEAQKETPNQLKKQLHIPEEFQMEALNTLGKWGYMGYQADCKVDVPIEGKPAVYQQKQRPFTKEEITKKAQKLFDSGEYSYVKPLDCYTLEELREETASVEKVIGNENNKDTDYYQRRKGDVATYEECFKKSEVREYKEGDFTKGAEAANYDKILIMEGKIGGENYHLLAFTNEGHNYLKLCRLDAGYALSDLDPRFSSELKYLCHKGEELENEIGYGETVAYIGEEVYIYQVSMNEMEPPTQTIRNQFGGNKCSYSEEEAARLALQYATLFGDTDMTITKTYWSTEQPYAASNMDEDESLANSYIFYLQPQYGGLTCNESNFWWREAIDTGEEVERKVDPLGIVAEQQKYRVKVTDKGVVSIDTIEPWYEITETLSESTSLMDFNEIEELAKGYFMETVKDIRVNEASGKAITQISEVNLRYATVLYDGEYTLIPCWFFNKNDPSAGGKSTILVINAIDGSKVFFSDFNKY